MSKNSKNLVVVLAKAPTVGQVKTRLGADIGAAKACRIYRSLADEVWVGLLKARTSLGFSAWLAYDPSDPSDPPEAQVEMRAWLPGADAYLPQQPGDLGDRIRRAFQAGFEAGFTTVLITGTDAPDVASKHYETAFEKAEPGLAVVGPSEDGGFYLLALHGEGIDLHNLFAGIPWSCSTTRAILHRNASGLGLGWVELEPLSDVDTLQDLRRVRPGLLAP